MYARTSFRGAKTCEIGKKKKKKKKKKRYVFGHIDKFWKGHDPQIKLIVSDSNNIFFMA